MVTWVLYLSIGVIAGFAAGFYFSHLNDGNKKKCEDLEGQLTNAKDEISSYKQNVTNHFVKTSNLINNMTDSYRAIYDHMSEGAKSLCPESLIDNPVGKFQLDIPKAILIETDLSAENSIKLDTSAANESQGILQQTSEMESDVNSSKLDDADSATVSASASSSESVSTTTTIPTTEQDNTSETVSMNEEESTITKYTSESGLETEEDKITKPKSDTLTTEMAGQESIITNNTSEVVKDALSETSSNEELKTEELDKTDESKIEEPALYGKKKTQDSNIIH